jgi:mono/diheme cytochrome c family protein
MGLLDAPLPKPYKAALAVPDAGNTSASVEQRVRSYLHGNCSACHRPGGDYSNIDFRNDVSFADTHTCGQSPGEGNLGVVGAKIITPTMPMMSVLWLRMNTLSVDDGRMPRLGSYVIDQNAVTMVGAWIMGLTTCPQ